MRSGMAALSSSSCQRLVEGMRLHERTSIVPDREVVPTRSFPSDPGGKMLDEADFRDWCSRQGLALAAQEAIAAIRQGRPACSVGGGQRTLPVAIRAGRWVSQFSSRATEWSCLSFMSQSMTVKY